MQGTNSLIKIAKPQRIRHESFDTKLERKVNERTRQAARSDDRNRKYTQE